MSTEIITRTILDRWTGAVLWEGPAATVREAIHAANQVSVPQVDVTDANLTHANLTVIRDDLWAVLSGAPMEVPALIAALQEGRVDGSSDSGLVGTLANARGCYYSEFSPIVPCQSRPAEILFVGIQKGDTPAANQRAKLAVEWSQEWLDRMRAAFGGVANA